MEKKSIKFVIWLNLFIIVMSLTLISGSSYARAEEVTSGKCGTNLTWELNGGVLTISGTGDLYSNPWYDLRETIQEVIIEDGTTGIGNYVFSYSSNLRTVTMPDSVKFIAQNAFYQCSSLSSLSISKNVTSIGGAAFADCSSLTNVTIPDSVTNMGNAVFSGCSGLTSVTLSDRLTSMGERTFKDCSALTSIVLPDGLTSIEEDTFRNCSSLESVTIPDSVTSIGASAFYQCENLKSISIPANVTKIEGSTFSGCSSLVSVTLPEHMESIGRFAFCDCSSLTSIAIPEGVTSINTCTFVTCTSLSRVSFPETLTTIADLAFKDCNSLDHITLPGSLTVIQSEAFSGCSGLTSLIIPENVTEIGKKAFYKCSGLTDITIPDAVTAIGTDAFYECSKLESVKLPEGLTQIGDRTFEGCTKLSRMAIPNSVKSIGKFVFWEIGLDDVYFTGSKDEWDAIELGECNKALLHANIHYHSVGFTGSLNDEFSGSSIFSSAALGGYAKYRFYYNNSWFFNNSSGYQHDLAKMSMRVALAAFDKNWVDDSDRGKCIKGLMNKLGFDYTDSSIHYPNPEENSIGYAIGSRKITDENGDTASLIMVAVRGGGYQAEWAGNFNVGPGSGKHDGFSRAEIQVRNGLEEYLNDNADKLEDRMKVWICGYSRAAATSNLLAADLDNGAINGINKKNVYAFCFECPYSTGEAGTRSDQYDNINNIINPLDFVPKIPMSDFGFKRYGIDRILPSAQTLGWKDYTALKEKMASQYNALFRFNEEHSKLDPFPLNFRVRNFYEFVNKNVTLDTEALGQASTFDDFCRNVSDQVGSRDTYYMDYQRRVTDLIKAKYFGYGDPYPLINDFINTLVSLLPGVVAKHPVNSSQVVTYAGTHLLEYAHYPELCMSWLDALDGSSFKIDSDYSYRKAYINCPVNVSVYNNEDTLVARITDDKVEEIEGGLYAYIDDNDQKVVVMPGNEEYRVVVEATDEGNVSYAITEYDAATGECQKSEAFYDVAVENGDQLTAAVPATAEGSDYTLVKGEEKLSPDLNETGEITSWKVDISVSGNGEASGGGTFTTGQYCKLTAQADAGYEFQGWYKDDELISSEAKYRFRVEQNTNITAKFIRQEKENGKTDSGTDTNETQSGSSSKSGSAKLKKVLFKNTKKTLKFTKLRKKKKSYSVIKASSGGKVTAKYLKKGKISRKICKKYVSVSKRGKVTVKKGARKGIYKIKITVAAKKGYQKTSKIIYIKVR